MIPTQTLTAVVFLLMLPACSLVDALRRTAQNTADLVEQSRAALTDAQEVATAARSEFKEACSKADVDKDGKTSALEWLAYVTGGLGSGYVALRSIARNVKSDGRKDLIEMRLDKLEG